MLPVAGRAPTGVTRSPTIIYYLARGVPPTASSEIIFFGVELPRAHLLGVCCAIDAHSQELRA
jgi:hypothetical protein